MKANKNLLIGIVLGATITSGVFIILILSRQREFHNTQRQFQQIQITQKADNIEAIRQGSLEGLMGNVLNKIDSELKDNPKRILSDETVTRIAALCYSFVPHTDTEGDGIAVKKLSPGRGHLLLMLSKMNIDSASFKKILFQGSFSGSVLTDADLSGANLKGVDLKGADLKGANLNGANLSGADLRKANLWGANLINAKLSEADMTRADLSWANLNGADMRYINLTAANLISAQLRKTDLREAILKWADFSGAFLNESNVSGAEMFRTTFNRAQLEGAILIDGNLTLGYLIEANLKRANLNRVNLTGTNLTGLAVSEQNWLTLLDEWHVTGSQEIQKKYKLETVNSNGESYLLLK